MSAPKGNINARKGHHQRVSVPFSGKILDAIYASLGMYEHENEPDKVREAVLKLAHDALRDLRTARCFNGPKCHTGAHEQDTSEMVWCEISRHYGWYCGICYEVEHGPKDEAKFTLAMYKQQQEESDRSDQMKFVGNKIITTYKDAFEAASDEFFEMMDTSLFPIMCGRDWLAEWGKSPEMLEECEDRAGNIHHIDGTLVYRMVRVKVPTESENRVG